MKPDVMNSSDTSIQRKSPSWTQRLKRTVRLTPFGEREGRAKGACSKSSRPLKIASQSNVQKELDQLQRGLSAEREGLKFLEDEIEPLQLQQDRVKKLKEELLGLESEFTQGATSIGLATDFGDVFRFEDIQREVTSELSRLANRRSRCLARPFRHQDHATTLQPLGACAPRTT